MVLIFTAFFEWSIGPILWLYLAEILPSAGLSIAVFLNWAVVVAIGFLTPIMIKASRVMTFSIYAVCCLVGGFFIIIFIKETKGLSKERLKTLYSPNGYSNQVTTVDDIGEEEELIRRR